VTAGQDAFLGRGISKIVIDPTNPSHIYVGSALGVRGLSHVIGNGGTTRFPPNANNVGLYESTDGGATFTEVWDGHGSTFGVIDVGLDPLNPATVYASAFDQGLWRRSPALDGSATPYDFHQVFAPQYPGGGTDRTTLQLLADGQRQPTGRDTARLAGGRLDAAAGRDRRSSVLQRLAGPDGNRDVESVLRDDRLLHRPVLVRLRCVHPERDA
jgi:hypothetical protein